MKKIEDNVEVTLTWDGHRWKYPKNRKYPYSHMQSYFGGNLYSIADQRWKSKGLDNEKNTR